MSERKWWIIDVAGRKTYPYFGTVDEAEVERHDGADNSGTSASKHILHGTKDDHTLYEYICEEYHYPESTEAGTVRIQEEASAVNLWLSLHPDC